ncbi:MAG: corrinoid protein-associated methyltransferase CpaM [Candidatus Thorarchaeota archaeon]
MSYVYMRALETAPERYDKGIGWLGWGQLGKIRMRIADDIASVANNVLEIGVGTGTQALLFAKRGLRVIGIDHSSGMLAIAQRKLDFLQEEDPGNGKVVKRITLQQKAAVQLDEFPPDSFDAVTATLVFSELWDSEQRYVLANSYRLLRPGGLLVIADEMIPTSRVKRLLHAIISAPLKALTYLLIQTSTRPVRDLKQKLASAGFDIVWIDCYQLDSFQVIIAKKPEGPIQSEVAISAKTISPPHCGLMTKAWETAARMVGHPTEIGLLPVNDPTPNSPVLCTCNFKLTVGRLYDLLKDKGIDAWILAAPTDGINVWCAACGGDFNAGSVITAIKISGLDETVSHRTIILPQLAAPGVDPIEVRKATDWKCVWGPVHLNDLVDFLHDYPKSIKNKPEQQRAIQFRLPFRLEIGSALAFPMMLILGLLFH